MVVAPDQERESVVREGDVGDIADSESIRARRIESTVDRGRWREFPRGTDVVDGRSGALRVHLVGVRTRSPAPASSRRRARASFHGSIPLPAVMLVVPVGDSVELRGQLPVIVAPRHAELALAVGQHDSAEGIHPLPEPCRPGAGVFGGRGRVRVRGRTLDTLRWWWRADSGSGRGGPRWAGPGARQALAGVSGWPAARAAA